MQLKKKQLLPSHATLHLYLFKPIINSNLPGATYLKYTYNHRTPSQRGHNVAHSFWQRMSIHLSLGCSTPQ